LVTKKFLHSHKHISPLSRNQEVSAFGNSERFETDAGDNWAIECVDTKETVWRREKPIRLRHVDTDLYLFTDPKHHFGHPIPGQIEISAVKPPAFKGGNRGEQWTVKVDPYIFIINSSSHINFIVWPFFF
jgi:dolichyl-phosphate-mannose--protein O-mannosyl transferase